MVEMIVLITLGVGIIHVWDSLSKAELSQPECFGLSMGGGILAKAH